MDGGHLPSFPSLLCHSLAIEHRWPGERSKRANTETGMNRRTPLEQLFLNFLSSIRVFLKNAPTRVQDIVTRQSRWKFMEAADCTSRSQVAFHEVFSRRSSGNYVRLKNHLRARKVIISAGKTKGRSNQGRVFHTYNYLVINQIFTISVYFLFMEWWINTKFIYIYIFEMWTTQLGGNQSELEIDRVPWGLLMFWK